MIPMSLTTFFNPLPRLLPRDAACLPTPTMSSRCQQLCSRQRSIGAAALTGICWGAGHGLTMLIVGGAIVLFGFVVPERLGLSLELGVALMLIVLGVLNVSGTVRRGSRDSGGRRPWSRARHLPQAAGNAFWRVVPVSSRPARWRLASCMGWLDRRAVTLLVLPIIHDPLSSMAYLATFGVGTIAGMMLITALVAAALSIHAEHTGTRFIAGWVRPRECSALVFGVFLVYQIGFVDGLFTSITK